MCSRKIRLLLDPGHVPLRRTDSWRGAGGRAASSARLGHIRSYRRANERTNGGDDDGEDHHYIASLCDR